MGYTTHHARRMDTAAYNGTYYSSFTAMYATDAM